MDFHIENIFLFFSVLLSVSIIVSKAGARFGIPLLLLFLIIGIVAGTEKFGLNFTNTYTAQIIGNVSLVIILFAGGMDTNYHNIKNIIFPGSILSTLGVFITAVVSAFFINFILGRFNVSPHFGFLESFLLASIMASTDSASVFGILRGKKINIRNNVKSILEFESGSNDPMAYIMTITLIQLIINQDSEVNVFKLALMIFLQIIIGIIIGYIFGNAVVTIMNIINLNNHSLYSVLLLGCAFFIYSFTTIIYGNGFLAVYISALVIGNHKFVHRKSISNFIEGLAWLFQIIMFLVLGLLVSPEGLMSVAGVALIIGAFVFICARPIAVFISLLPFKKFTFKSDLFISWVGLKGAVPIIFATYAFTYELPQAQIIFDIVFFITLLSLLVQGGLIPFFAHAFKVDNEKNEKKSPIELQLPDDMKGIISEIIITNEILSNGSMLMNLPLPDKTLAVLIMRDNKYFIPKGRTILKEGDKLVLISENEKELKQTMRFLGIDMKDYDN